MWEMKLYICFMYKVHSCFHLWSRCLTCLMQRDSWRIVNCVGSSEMALKQQILLTGCKPQYKILCNFLLGMYFILLFWFLVYENTCIQPQVTLNEELVWNLFFAVCWDTSCLTCCHGGTKLCPWRLNSIEDWLLFHFFLCNIIKLIWKGTGRKWVWICHNYMWFWWTSNKRLTSVTWFMLVQSGFAYLIHP